MQLLSLKVGILIAYHWGFMQPNRTTVKLVHPAIGPSAYVNVVGYGLLYYVISCCFGCNVIPC